MTEDISATTRIAVTLCIIAALMAVTINLLIMSNSVLQNFAIKYTIAATNQEPSALWGLNQVRTVNGALLYRILTENESRIDIANAHGQNFVIRDLKANGTKGGAINTIADFKEKANKEYEIRVVMLDNGLLKVTGDEVKP